MTRVRLYLDEDAMENSLVHALRSRHVDVVTVFEAGMGGKSDDDNLLWSSDAGRVLYTFNAADYCRIHTRWLELGRHHGGIVVAAQQRLPIGEQARRLLRLISTTSAEEMTNRLEYLGNWKD